MPSVTKINSGKGLVTFSREELIDLDLTKWIRANSKGYGKRDFIDVQPLEKEAAKAYKDKYPSSQIKIAEKCFLNKDGGVDIVLRVAQDVSSGYYNSHPTKLTFLGDVKSKEQAIQPTYNEEIENRKEKSSGLSVSIDFLEENIDKLSDDEKRQIFAELGKENVTTFLEDLRIIAMETASIDKVSEELRKLESDDDCNYE